MNEITLDRVQPLTEEDKTNEITPDRLEVEGAETTKPTGSVLESAVKNFPSSAGNLIKNTVMGIPQAVKLGAEGFGSAIIGKPAAEMLGIAPDPDIGKKIVEVYKERYGGIENLKKTIAEDPAGFIADVSTFFTGVGGVLPKVGGVGSKVASVGKVASKVGKLTDPVMAVTAPIKGAVKTVIPSKMPTDLYMSALKPSTKTLENMLEVSDYGLSNQIPITYGSWKKIGSEIKKSKSEVDAIIKEGTESGKTINIEKVIQNLDNIKTDYAPFSWKPELIEKQVDSIKKKLVDYHNARTSGKLTPAEVQKLKVTQYKDLENSYGQLSLVAKDQIQKGLAYGAKEALEGLYPELKKINLKEGELIAFNKHLEKALMSHAKSDIVRNISFFIKAVVDQPWLKSRVAIWFDRAKKGHPLSNPHVLGKDLVYQLRNINEAKEEFAENEQ